VTDGRTHQAAEVDQPFALLGRDADRPRQFGPEDAALLHEELQLPDQVIVVGAREPKEDRVDEPSHPLYGALGFHAVDRDTVSVQRREADELGAPSRIDAGLGDFTQSRSFGC